MPFGRSFGQSSRIYPAKISTVLIKSGGNRPELEKAINYFSKSQDTLKLRALYFLLANMDIHFSVTNYWVDSLEQRIPEQYNELDYPDFASAVSALASYREKWPGCRGKKIIVQDLQVLTSKYLIDNINLSFDAWAKSGAKVSFDDFCEYILPYRVGVEPVQNWRSIYRSKYQWVTDSLKTIGLKPTLGYLAVETRNLSFQNTFGRQSIQLLPRLGALQLLLRKQGDCPDMVAFSTFKLRSQGIPAAFNMITYWATSSDRHFLGSVLGERNRPIKFDATSDEPFAEALSSEPAKVLRETYSKQSGTLASQESIVNIPPNFLRNTNYIDVTKDYWEVVDLKLGLYPDKKRKELSFCCVYNEGNWQPTWWGKIVDDSVTFKDMAKGVVYLPVYYHNGTILPAGDPVIMGYHEQLVLKPNTLKTHSVSIAEQDKYLFFRPGKSYELFYWDKDWISLGSKKAGDDAHEMVFESVPQNALLLLLPDYSTGKERPFIITNDGKRYWW